MATQEQAKQTLGYVYDPTGRPLETIATGEPNGTIISHYAGPGGGVAWTSEPLLSETQRNITGLNGQLVALQSNSEAPVLQVTNLHGDVVATASLSETATELASHADTSEYGVPTVKLPAKYSWLGAIELPTELAVGGS